MKKPRALAILQKTFAFESPRVPRDREMNFLPSGLGKIQTREIARRPVGTGVKVMPGPRIHQGKLHLPRNFGAPDGPVAALSIIAEKVRHTQNHACDYKNQTDASFQIHGTCSSPYFPQNSENVSILAPHQLVHSQIFTPILPRLLNELWRYPL